MSGFDFFDLARRQRACRDFSDHAVSDSDLAMILDAATHAPSAHNCQPWEFVVVRAAEIRERIAQIARGTWDGARTASRSRLEPRLFRDVDQFIHERNFGGAPVLIIIGVDRTKLHEAMIGPSIYPATQNLLLGAAALGYGSTFTNFTFTQNAAAAEVLGLPEHVEVAGIIALGRPAKELGPASRQPFAERTHRERFGAYWSGDVT